MSEINRESQANEPAPLVCGCGTAPDGAPGASGCSPSCMLPVPTDDELAAEIDRAEETAEAEAQTHARGYAEAVARLRDDDRYRDWWSPRNDKPTRNIRLHLADYLETVGPDGVDVETGRWPAREQAVQPTGVHAWSETAGLSVVVTACTRCGIVQRRDGQHGPCRGPVRVELRAQAVHDALVAAKPGDVFAFDQQPGQRVLIVVAAAGESQASEPAERERIASWLLSLANSPNEIAAWKERHYVPGRYAGMALRGVADDLTSGEPVAGLNDAGESQASEPDDAQPRPYPTAKLDHLFGADRQQVRAEQRRHTLLFNAITRTLAKHGRWIPLSDRMACAAAALAALDGAGPAAPKLATGGIIRRDVGPVLASEETGR